MTTVNDSFDQSLDITRADHVEIEIREDGKVIWVNTPFGCKLRICRIESLEIIDHRPASI